MLLIYNIDVGWFDPHEDFIPGKVCFKNVFCL